MKLLGLTPVTIKARFLVESKYLTVVSSVDGKAFSNRRAKSGSLARALMSSITFYTISAHHWSAKISRGRHFVIICRYLNSRALKRPALLTWSHVWKLEISIRERRMRLLGIVGVIGTRTSGAVLRLIVLPIIRVDHGQSAENKSRGSSCRKMNHDVLECRPIASSETMHRDKSAQWTRNKTIRWVATDFSFPLIL